MVWLGWALSGCEQIAATCGPEECAEVCGAAPAEPGEPAEPTTEPATGPEPPTEWEQQVLDQVLVEIRKGVQPWDDTSIGICKGRRDCDKFLGVNPGRLGRGYHFVKAELRVPPGPPGTWKVKFQTDCKTPEGETKTFEREYDVVSNGDQPFRLWPLREIASPNEEGPETCTWTLTTPDPRGDRTYTGSWEVAGK